MLRPGLNAAQAYGVWLAASVPWCAAVAWIAFQVQQDEIAPAVLFPLAVGGVLGAGGLAIRRFTRVPRAGIAIAAAVVSGLLVVVGQDYIGHWHDLRLYDERFDRQAAGLALAVADSAEMRPGFGEFLTGRIRAHPAWWGLELTLTAAASGLVTTVGTIRKTLPAPADA